MNFQNCGNFDLPKMLDYPVLLVRARPEDLYAEIGRRLRAAREELGLTQAEVARLVSITEATLSRYESGDRRLGMPLLRQLARVLGKPVSYFLTGEVPSERDVFFYEMESLTPEEREEALDYIRFLRERRKKREK